MKKYLVYAKLESEYEIEATSEEEALNIAYQYLIERDFDDCSVEEMEEEEDDQTDRYYKMQNGVFKTV